MPRINDEAYIINLEDKNSKGTHWVSLFVAYFDSSGIEYIPLEVLNKTRYKSITHNIFRKQDNESIMYGLYCIAFIEYILTGKTSLDNTNLFHPNDYKKNDKIIHKHFYGR